MLTRRENLLVRPWQQRRYHQHRKKVESALPAIDVGPPAERGHVSCKLKQIQTEEERCAQIGKDNCALVLRLAHIMRTSRVDNVWRQPPPAFLRRVGIYMDPACTLPPSPPSPSSSTRPRPRTAASRLPTTSATPSRSTSRDGGHVEDKNLDEGDEKESQDSEGRNLRCMACHPRTALRRERRCKETETAPTDKIGVPPTTVAAPRVPAGKGRIPRAVPTSAPTTRGTRGGSIPLDQVVITYKALRLAISFPHHASVRIRSARTTAHPSPSSARVGSELRPSWISNMERNSID